MVSPIESIDMPSMEDFVETYVARNRPVVVRGLDYDPGQWVPEALKERIGEMTSLVYGSLFDLDDVQTLKEYLEIWFGLGGEMERDVPYVRWYNKLRDVEFSWGDEALRRMESAWRMPSCLPKSDLIVPVSKAGVSADPVRDTFPYRGLLVAARGARTRMHRDPFCSDAVVCQFYGTKEAALYSPDRAAELSEEEHGSSFGGFVDVRADALDTLSVEPDFHGFVSPGEMIYIPHGWLHDVLAIEDSVSVTWNFVHARGAAAFAKYLDGGWDGDSEFEILQYFHRPVGENALTARQIAEYHFSPA